MTEQEMVFIEDLPMRGTDRHGQGHWMASRGRRKHKGIDLVIKPSDLLCSAISGTVTKLGTTYRDPDKSVCRYVELTIKSGYALRFHYIMPMVTVGDKIQYGDILGEAIDIEGLFYKDMLNHVHFGIRDRNGKRVDPTLFWVALGGHGVVNGKGF